MFHRDHCQSFFAASRLSGAVLALACVPAMRMSAQNAIAANALDPARDAAHLTEFRTAPLAEQYIWTPAANEAGLSSSRVQWIFRTEFSLGSVPEAATLYVAASGDVDVWVNGVRLLAYLDDHTVRPGYTVHAIDARGALHAGRNALAIRVHHLHGAHHTTTDPLTLQFVGGRALAVKLLSAARGVPAEPLLISDTAWHGRAVEDDTDPQTASDAGYDASSWPQVVSLGKIDGNIAFYQWNADAGMYAWPSYMGASPYLRHYTLRSSQLVDLYTGSAEVENAEMFTQAPKPGSAAFTVRRSAASPAEQSPALTVDFGREVAGRIHLRSDSDQPALLTASYGESKQEALYQPFLGVRTIYVPPNGEAWGPKSGFRYVRLHFLTDARLTAIDLDGIAYPVEYKGAFASSDARLDRIWETAAYTAHLCMQDGIWDGIKRDRARWSGDLDVSGRIINDVFADRALLEDTFTRLLEETGGTHHVNGITGYSALWIDGVTEFYKHSGDQEFLLSLHHGLLDLLKTMDRDISSDGLFVPAPHEHVFVDWAPDLHADTPEARRATEFEYLLAYKQAAWLFGEMGDRSAAAHYEARYQELRAKARKQLRDAQTHAFGATWQTNAMAVLSGAADQKDYVQLWQHVFSSINHVTSYSPAITPYYGYYVLEAMAVLGHRAEALEWLRSFWGGMIDEGATSFWESYDPRWTRNNFHSGLQADGLAGYYVSLAHTWSAGPAAWLSEQVLGIRSTGAGFSAATIEPELAGLKNIEGSVPTPRGNIHVLADAGTIALDLPAGTTATVLIEAPDTFEARVNGVITRTVGAPIPGYRSVRIVGAGHYEIAH